MNEKLLSEYGYLDKILQIIYDADLKTLSFYSLFDKLYNVHVVKTDLANSYKGIYTEGMTIDDFFNKNFELDSEDFRLKIVLEYLLEEYFIKREGSDSFKITYKGRLQLAKSFVSDYTKLISDEKRIRKLEKNQKRTNKNMVILTCVLVSIAIVEAICSLRSL